MTPPSSLKTLTEETAARVKTEGPGGFANLWGDVQDDMWGSMSRQATETSQLAEDIRRGVDPKLTRARWQRLSLDNDAFMGRTWDRMEARFKGMSTSAKELNLIESSDVVMSTFKEWRGGWKKFFGDRRKLLDDFFAEGGGKGGRTFESITEELDPRYAGLIEAESAYHKKIDDIVTDFFPEGDPRKFTYAAYRQRVREFQRLDKESVLAFRAEVRGLRPEQVGPAYAGHWKARQAAWTNLWAENRRGLAAMSGSAEGMAAYAPDAQRLAQEAAAARAAGELPIMQKIRRAEAIKANATPEEAARLKELSGIEEVLPKDISKVPRDQLPQELSREIEYTAKRMEEELSMGEAPLTLKIQGEEGGAEVSRYTRMKSTNPDWFQEFAAEHKVTKKKIYDALDKIVEDAGKDKGKLVERLKRVIKEQMLEPDPLTGEPPNPRVIEMLQGQTGEVTQAERAAELRKIEEGILARGPQAEGAPPTQAAFVPDFHQFVKRQEDYASGLDELWRTRGSSVVDDIESESLAAMQKKSLKFGDLTPQQQQKLLPYVEHVKTGMSDARYATTRFSEFGRDSALLNYNRRYNYNTWAGMIFPYEFWATQSMFKWALHSIDRPAMLASYLRIKKFLDTAYRPEQGLPTRLRGMIRIPLPFAPDWMGKELFIDPLRMALPFDSWLGIPEMIDKQKFNDVGATERVLRELMNDGKISRTEYEAAVRDKSGALWERGMALARQDDTEDRLNPMDFVSMFSNPHVPIGWALDAASGREPEATLPITNTLGGVYGALGIDPAGPLNPEAAIRKQLGLHPFGRWDDYRTERSLVNMLAVKDITYQQFQEALNTHKGDVWQKAYGQAAYEKSGGLLGAALTVLGLPPKAYPEGEKYVRQLADDYAEAVREYEMSGDYASTIGEFKDEHPEWEARLALFKKPEERARQFLVDAVWDRWNNLPKVHKDEFKELLGRDFVEKFYDKETRSYDSISQDELQFWLTAMDGEVPGLVNMDATAANLMQLRLTDPDKAWRAEAFYQNREKMFGTFIWDRLDEFSAVPEGRVYVAPADVTTFVQERERRYGEAIFDTQNEYYSFPKGTGQRKRFLNEHPELREYWSWKADWEAANPDAAAYLDSDAPITRSTKSLWLDKHPEVKQYFQWRDDFIKRNPDVASIISDNPKYETEAFQQYAEQQGGQNQFTLQEWRNMMGASLSNLILDYGAGEPLPEDARTLLRDYSWQYGYQGDVEAFATQVASAP